MTLTETNETNNSSRNAVILIFSMTLLLVSIISFGEYSLRLENSPQTCKNVFTEATGLSNNIITNLSSRAELCGGPDYFEQYSPDLQNATPYTIDGNAIKTKDRVFSTKGMTIKKNSHWYYFIEMRVPSILITVGDQNVELMFASKEEQTKHFDILSSAIAKS